MSDNLVDLQKSYQSRSSGLETLIDGWTKGLDCFGLPFEFPAAFGVMS